MRNWSNYPSCRGCGKVGNSKSFPLPLSVRIGPAILAALRRMGIGKDELTVAVIALASQYGRYGYKKIAALLQMAGWAVGRDRVEQIWKREGLKVPRKQRPRRRLWLNDGSCIRLRPERANHVWSYDFLSARTHEGRLLRILALIDEYTRECLALRVARRLNSRDVIETLSDVMLWREIPEQFRSDNGPELVSQSLRT